MRINIYKIGNAEREGARARASIDYVGRDVGAGVAAASIGLRALADLGGGVVRQ